MLKPEIPAGRPVGYSPDVMKMCRETTDEWTIRDDEEWLAIMYEEWEGDWEWEDEHLTLPICYECGNQLTWFSVLKLFTCGVCE